MSGRICAEAQATVWYTAQHQEALGRVGLEPNHYITPASEILLATTRRNEADEIVRGEAL